MDTDYWIHAELNVEWDEKCRIIHGQPTWYFSFMGRREKMDLFWKKKKGHNWALPLPTRFGACKLFVYNSPRTTRHPSMRYNDPAQCMIDKMLGKGEGDQAQQRRKAQRDVLRYFPFGSLYDEEGSRQGTSGILRICNSRRLFLFSTLL